MTATPPTQLAIIADDLTGALDAAAPFAIRGLRTVVATAPDHVAAALRAGPRVLAVSTNSREMSEGAAVAAVLTAGAALRDVPEMFKKIDSRLKGHVRAETAALARQKSLGGIMVCTAVPELGRVISGGQLTGFGIGQPIRVAAVLNGAGLSFDLALDLPDAASDADLDALVARPGHRLLAGARGLASALARRLSGQPAAFLAAPPLPRPLAIAIGSRDPITVEQAAELSAARPDVPVSRALNGRFTGPVPAGPLVALQTAPGAEPADPDRVQRAFAASFTPAFTAGRRTLILTGGATAAAILARLRIGLLEIEGESAPGIPVSRALDAPEPLSIVTKSGGFGAPDILVALIASDPAAARRTGRGLAQA